jgi:hypothetical protein
MSREPKIQKGAQEIAGWVFQLQTPQDKGKSLMSDILVTWLTFFSVKKTSLLAITALGSKSLAPIHHLMFSSHCSSNLRHR